MSGMQPAAEHLRGAIDLSSLVNRNAPAAPGAPAAAPVSAASVPAAPGASVDLPGLVLEGTDANFSQFLELSAQIPILVDLYAGSPTPGFDSIVESYGGRLVLVTVDVTTNLQLRQAFQVQSVPAAVALIGGRPLQLFAGAVPEDQVRQVLEQVLQAAAQSGVTGTVSVSGATTDDVEPVVPPLPPLHAEAYDAIEQGDYPRAITAYKTAIAQNPTDKMAVAGLAQVSLLDRLHGKTIEQIRSAGADSSNLDAQLDVADLDLSGGHVEDAFDRLLTRFETSDADDRTAIRTRLLELFEVAGLDDPRVMRARARLTNLLY